MERQEMMLFCVECFHCVINCLNGCFELFQQLRANIREMEKLCSRVRKEDILALQRMINPMKEQASLAVKEFLQLHSESAEELKKRFNDTELTRSTTVGAGKTNWRLYS